MTDEDITKIVTGTVDTLKAAIVGLSVEDLRRVRAAEVDQGNASGRSTALAAIDAAIAGSTPTVLREGTGEDTLAIPADLSGLPLNQLEIFRTQAADAAGANANDPDLARVEAAIADLHQRSADAPEVKADSTATKHLDQRTALDALKAGPCQIQFGEDRKRLEDVPGLRVDFSNFSLSGGRPILQKPIYLGRDLEPCNVTHIALVSEDGEGAVVAICEIPGGLAAGGGREAEFPAGSLIF